MQQPRSWVAKSRQSVYCETRLESELEFQVLALSLFSKTVSSKAEASLQAAKKLPNIRVHTRYTV
jgi:hypothetical protein